MAIAGEQILIGPAQRAHQQTILHRALIHKQILVIGNAPIPRRNAGQPRQVQAFALQIDRDSVAGKIRANDRRQPRQRRLRAGIGQRRQVQKAPAVVFDHETHFGPRHGQPSDMIKASGQLGTWRFQELAPRRHLGEQAIDPRHRPRRRTGRAVVDDTAIVHHQPPALPTFRPAGQRQGGDRADRGQRFTTKPHGRNGSQIFIGQFGRRMPLDRQPQLVWRHADAIIGHFQPIDAAIHQAHPDAPGAGIQCVFNQFLGGTGRPLHHLAGGDAVDQGFRQVANRHRPVLRAVERTVMPRPFHFGLHPCKKRHSGPKAVDWSRAPANPILVPW